MFEYFKKNLGFLIIISLIIFGGIFFLKIHPAEAAVYFENITGTDTDGTILYFSSLPGGSYTTGEIFGTRIIPVGDYENVNKITYFLKREDIDAGYSIRVCIWAGGNANLTDINNPLGCSNTLIESDYISLLNTSTYTEIPFFLNTPVTMASGTSYAVGLQLMSSGKTDNFDEGLIAERSSDEQCESLTSIAECNESTWNSSGTRTLFDATRGIKLRLENVFINTDTSTRIVLNEPLTGTASTTFNVDFDYYLNSENSNADLWQGFLVQVCPLSYSSDVCQKFFFEEELELDSLENLVYEVSSSREGFHLILINFWNGIEEDDLCNWWEPFCVDEVSQVGPGTSNNFNVATTTIEADVPPWLQGGGLCPAFTGFEWLCNALAFLFIPSQNTIDQLASTQDILASKIPFGFFFVIKSKLDTLLETEPEDGGSVVVDTGSSGLGEVAIFDFGEAKSTFDSMGFGGVSITNILTWFLWLGFGFYCWRRLLGNNPETV